ncbi:MAG: prepilin-type N-terminal cleavage/methylation domain-containing protein [Lachnospiraceae bacterium]|nr:prepilin-type N-terminal cleavage/methylation domain-containing protein [Lachnospiraceae bacterium]MDE6626577.1 prepilin-type N-terminal cleavage/methylation domain-containing protein [Lachnospiraceae bacterium]
MSSQINRNRGFTIVELLISMALLSIVMVMVVQFMSSTVAANRKTKENLRAQTEAKEVMTSIMDSLVPANYVQVRPYVGTVYEMSKDNGSRKEALSEQTGSIAVTLSSNTTIVPDNYGNYVRNTDTNPDERKVIIDMDTYKLLGEKTTDGPYPLSDDLDKATADARSFRILKQEVDGDLSYLYIKPMYIYAEYNVTDSAGNITGVSNVIYYFKYKSGGQLESIYLYRSPETSSMSINTETRWYKALIQASSLATAGSDKGLLTKNISDFYLSADAEGEAFLVDALFDVDGYLYNAADTINFRNSSVLTVRPQNAYKAANGSGGSGGSGGGEATPEE